MISGGLNGGALTIVVTIGVLCAAFSSIVGTAMLVAAILSLAATVLTSGVMLVVISSLLAFLIMTVVEMNRSMLVDYMDYMVTGNLESAASTAEMAGRLGELSLYEMVALQSLTAYTQNVGGTTGGSNLDPELLNELANSGVKYNPDKVVAVYKNADGKLMWLEEGNHKVGLTHILE